MKTEIFKSLANGICYLFIFIITVALIASSIIMGYTLGNEFDFYSDNITFYTTQTYNYNPKPNITINRTNNTQINNPNLTMPITNLSGWILHWSEEFDQASLNTSSWNYEIGNLTNRGESVDQYLTNRSQNLFLTKGKLYMAATKESYHGFNYTSASINTNGKLNFQYGKIEIRAILPFGPSVWPSFKLIGSNKNIVGWPNCGEISVMEIFGNNPQFNFGSLIGSNFHYSRTFFNSQGFNTTYTNFTVIWNSTAIEYLVNGNSYYIETKSNITNAGNSWEFDQTFYIQLDLAISSSRSGSPASQVVWPQYLVLDYVKIWKWV